MADLRPLRGEISPDVFQAYLTFVGALPGLDLCGDVGRAIGAVAEVDRFYLYEQDGLERRPTMITARVEPRLQRQVSAWGERYRLADPIQRALSASKQSGGGMVLRVGPRDILDSDYRRPFFDEPAIAERVSVVQPVEGRWLVLHAARRRAFTDGELTGLASLSQMILPLAAQRLAMRPQARPGAAQMEGRFAARYPELSGRERQVCARTVLGMTAEATGLDLGIGVASVQTYRKRAYQRLGISSTYQLAQLVMD